jgi:hypothetical protein
LHAVHHHPVRIDRNDVLTWDDRRMLHARNAFIDGRRHLGDDGSRPELLLIAEPDPARSPR